MVEATQAETDGGRGGGSMQEVADGGKAWCGSGLVPAVAVAGRDGGAGGGGGGGGGDGGEVAAVATVAAVRRESRRRSGGQARRRGRRADEAGEAAPGRGKAEELVGGGGVLGAWFDCRDAKC